MSRKIGIIGIGNVGSTVAHHIVVCGFADDLILIDKNKQKVNADAQDLKEAMPNLPYHTNIVVNDYSALKDADVIISAVGKIALNFQKKVDRYVELPYNLRQVASVGRKIKASGFHGILVDITNPCDILTSRYQEVTGFPKSRVIGTGTLLDTARMKVAVAKELRVDPRSVSGFNLGEHGNTQFTAFSTVRVLGRPIIEIAKQQHLDLNNINETARKGGYTIMFGKHHTNFGVATAAVKLANVILNDARTELPVSRYCEKYGTYMSLPSIIGRQGILKNIHLHLTSQELKKLRYSANFIKKQADKYEN